MGRKEVLLMYRKATMLMVYFTGGIFVIYTREHMNAIKKNAKQGRVSTGTVHRVPADLQKALLSNSRALAAWEDITPLARNEWICWVQSVKKQETRREHVTRAMTELKEGKRRPCCWYGCIHRTDKAISASVRGVLFGKKSKKRL